MLLYLLDTPEAALLQFSLIGTHGTIINRAVNKHEFPLTFALKHIMPHRFRLEISNAQLFGHFALQSHLDILAQIHMPSHGGIPAAWLDILPPGTLLKIKLTPGRENMEMDYGMKRLGAAMRLPSGDTADDSPLFVH